MQVVEKRKFPRFQTNLLIREQQKQNFPFDKILDLSAGGLQLRCESQYKVSDGDQYSIVFSGHPSAPPIHATIRVVWVTIIPEQNTMTAGAEFVQISEESKSILSYLACKSRFSQFNLSDTFAFYFINLLRKNALRSPISNVRTLSIPKVLLEKLAPYKKLTNRDDLFYKCCYRAIEETTLPSVPPQIKEQLVEIKFTGFLFSILLDDLLDERREYALIEAASQIPFAKQPLNFESMNSASRDILRSLQTLWSDFYRQLKQAPHFQKLEKLFEYDYLQIINCLKYTSLLHRLPQANNSLAAKTVLPHSTHILINTTVDAMFSPGFEMNALGSIRQLAQIVQHMSHVINWVSSWKRELGNEDFTSGVFAYLLDQRITTVEELLDRNEREYVSRVIEQSDFKEYCFFLMDIARQELESCRNKISVLNMTNYLKGIENLLLMQMTYHF